MVRPQTVTSGISYDRSSDQLQPEPVFTGVDEEEEAPSSKKVKLTKEEKKALKKAMKAKAKSEAAAVVSFSSCVN